MMRLSDLVRMLFLPPYANGNSRSDLKEFAGTDNGKNQLKELARKLAIMRNRNPDLRWSPLVLLVIRRADLNQVKLTEVENAIYDFLMEVCENPDCVELDDKKNLVHGVKASFAGRAFAEFSSYFEFFAARFCPMSDTLFSDSHLKDLKKCLDHIDQVKEEAKKCIVTYVESINKFCEYEGIRNYSLLYSETVDEGGTDASDSVHYLYRSFNLDKDKGKWGVHIGKELTHPERIITDHIRYIDNFRLYATDKLLYALRAELGGEKSKIMPRDMAEEEKKGGWDEKTYLLKLCKKYNVVNPDHRQKIASVVKLAMGLLNIIGEYVDVLGDFTNLRDGAPSQFFIGGRERAKSNKVKRNEWGEDKFGHKYFERGLKRLHDFPLSRKSVFIDEDEA